MFTHHMNGTWLIRLQQLKTSQTGSNNRHAGKAALRYLLQSKQGTSWSWSNLCNFTNASLQAISLFHGAGWPGSSWRSIWHCTSPGPPNTDRAAAGGFSGLQKVLVSGIPAFARMLAVKGHAQTQNRKAQRPSQPRARSYYARPSHPPRLGAKHNKKTSADKQRETAEDAASMLSSLADNHSCGEQSDKLQQSTVFARPSSQLSAPVQIASRVKARTFAVVIERSAAAASDFSAGLAGLASKRTLGNRNSFLGALLRGRPIWGCCRCAHTSHPGS